LVFLGFGSFPALRSTIRNLFNHGPITSTTRRSNLPMSGKIQVTWGFATAQSWRSCAFHHGSCAQPQRRFRCAGVGDCSLHVPFTSIYNTSIDSSILSGNFKIALRRKFLSFVTPSWPAGWHGTHLWTSHWQEFKHPGRATGPRLKSLQKPSKTIVWHTSSHAHSNLEWWLHMIGYHFPTHFGLWLNSRHCSGVVSVTFSEDVTRALTMTSARSIAMYDTTGAAGLEWMDRRIQQR